MSRYFVLVIAFLLTGCSGGQTETPSVATLRSEAAPVTAPSSQRPVFRFDATADEKRAITKPWVDCMVENGGPEYRDIGETMILKGGAYADDPKGKAALETCLPQQPESFDEHLMRTDMTEFLDNQQEWYKCAEAAGYKLTAPDPETGQFGITEVGPNGDFGSPKMQECRRKAFTG